MLPNSRDVAAVSRAHVSRILVAPGILFFLLLAGCPAKPPNAITPAAKPQTTSGDKPVTNAAKEKPADIPAPAALFQDWPKPTVALVLTGQQLGYIEPCGCTGLENQKGGLARRHTLIKQLSEERGWPVLSLDVGSQVKRLGKQQEIKFARTTEGLRLMGYRGIALGENDLRLTPGELLAVMAGPQGTVTDFPSANVAVLARDLSPKYVVLEAGGKRIGVTAVLGATYQEKLRGDELVHEPPAAALAATLAELKSQNCDYLVLLAHATLEEARQFAQESKIFDIVVASGETSLPTRELESIGEKTRLLQVGLKAMHVGVVGLYGDSAAPVRYESVPLDARFADSPAMLKLLADYQDELRDLGFSGLNLKPQAVPSGRRFVGSEKCGECHTKAFEIWSKTGHAQATDSLVKPPNSRGDIARHFDPECLSCHVTGWQPQRFMPLQSGYQSLEATPQLRHNGCENCHGPGSEHVAAESGEMASSPDLLIKNREAMRLPLAGAEQKCLECHDDDNSPDFHHQGGFEAYWKKVEHRGKD
jgi:hypothetical protein